MPLDVSRGTAPLDEDLAKWRSRPLGQVNYLFLDARYKNVRHDVSIVDCSVLISIRVSATVAAAS
jgi:transposase-like protein